MASPKLIATNRKKRSMRYSKVSSTAILLVLATASAGCLATAAEIGPTSSMASDDLSCTLPTNCVTTIKNDGIQPLHFNGTAADALGELNATLASFPEAKITRTQDNIVEAVFTTPMGFKDTVLFRVNAAEKKIDFRSRSNFGLYDFGKNSTRMTELSARFAQKRDDSPATK
jgi:uncharacterized protein (DUF1499 family)